MFGQKQWLTATGGEIIRRYIKNIILNALKATAKHINNVFTAGSKKWNLTETFNVIFDANGLIGHLYTIDFVSALNKFGLGVTGASKIEYFAIAAVIGSQSSVGVSKLGNRDITAAPFITVVLR